MIAALLMLVGLGASAPAFAADPAAAVELGRSLFFDPRLSGDVTMQCAHCHDPGKAFADGLPLAVGYTSGLYFRNAPSLLDAADAGALYWDGRFAEGELEAVMRDHLAEAHFLLVDGRLLVERLRQVPEYRRLFTAAFGAEPSYGGAAGALAAFVGTLRTGELPLDRFLAGDARALSERARRGWALFTGKAGCSECHSGRRLSDGKFHARGVPEHRDLVAEPMRHIAFRRFLKTMGVAGYERLRRDPGRYAVTKDPADMGRFRTPSLRELARTAPYMHNGVFATPAEAVAFEARGKGLSDAELAELTALLQEGLSGTLPKVERPPWPDYAPMEPEQP